MIEMALLAENKETDNKVRWAADVQGTSFKLYIPKWRVPEPWPHLIHVTVSQLEAEKPLRLSREAAEAHPESCSRSIVAHLRKYREQTQTIRYRPEGDEKEWEIGEPYIPTAMTFDEAERLTITVDWK